MRNQVEYIIWKSPADVFPCSEWEFNAVFYPEEQRTAFKVSIFENASDPKNSCLVEMKLKEGDRVGFQALVSHVRSKAELKYAFAEQWGLDDKEEEEQFDDKGASYTHTSFAPPPLSSSLLAKLKPAKTIGDFKHPLTGFLLENSCSPYADVRRTAWQEMANSTNESAFAKSLLNARADGQDCITLAGESSGRRSAAGHAQLSRRSALLVDVSTDDELTRNDDTLVVTEERPPPLPYSWQVCSPNTFTCSDSSITPHAIQEQVKDIIRESAVDVYVCSEWEFYAVFYSEQQRTSFKVSIFENDADAKNSCLVKMQLQEGDRVAFQGLVSYVGGKAKLKGGW